MNPHTTDLKFTSNMHTRQYSALIKMIHISVMHNSGTKSMLISSTCRYFISDGEFQESKKKAKVKITKVQDIKVFSQLQN